MIPAQFGTKKFEVSSKKIYTPNGLSFSEELDYEETAVSGKKPTVSIKGIKLQELSFELKLDSRFVDVKKEMDAWQNLLRGKKSKRFILGKYELGYFFITKCGTKSVTLNRDNDYTSAILSMSFIEDGEYYNTASTKVVKANASKVLQQKASTTSTKKVNEVKSSPLPATTKVRIGSDIRPKSGVRWYYTAEYALKKSGKSGLAYQRTLRVKYVYSKNGKIVCVNPEGLGWLKVEDVSVIKY